MQLGTTTAVGNGEHVSRSDFPYPRAVRLELNSLFSYVFVRFAASGTSERVERKRREGNLVRSSWVQFVEGDGFASLFALYSEVVSHSFLPFIVPGKVLLCRPIFDKCR